VTAFSQAVQPVPLRRTPGNLFKTAWYKAYRYLPGATVNLYGYKFKAVNYRELERIFVTKLYEPEDFRYLLSKAQPGQIYLDVGANVGFYSIFMEKALAAEKVVAVEPSHRELSQLITNLMVNKSERVSVVGYAASNIEGKRHLQVATDYYRGANAIGRFYYPDTPRKGMETVELTTIDHIVTMLALPRVDWIKIDTDGHEYEVVLGALDTLKEHHPGLLIEYPSTPLVDKLMKLGYRPERLTGMFNTAFTWNG
jgi:FkbM family methyltransferase